MKKIAFILALVLTAPSVVAQTLSPRLSQTGEERLAEYINQHHPGLLKEKGLSPEQADEAVRAAATLRAPQRAASLSPQEGQQFWFVMPQGTLLGYKRGVHYVTAGEGTVNLLAEDLTGNMTARYNGALVDGHLHTISGDLSWVDYGLVICRDHVYDQNDNWQLYQSIDLSECGYLMSQEVAVDPVTQRVYGTFMRDDFEGYDIAWVDYSTHEIHRIGAARRDYPGLGMNSEGRLFGVDMDGVLYEISLTDGSDRAIGRTGIVVRDEDDRYFMQSAECGLRENVLYWMAVMPDGSSALYAVSLETAKAQKVCDLPRYTLAHCLTIPQNTAADASPAAVTGLRAAFEKASLEGILSFTLPTTTYAGSPLTEVGYQVRVDGQVYTTGDGDVGAEVIVRVALAEGLHYVEVYAVTDDGTSPQASITVFAGQDTPGAVQNPTLSVASDREVTISWQPAQGLHGGYPGEMTYTVRRDINGTAGMIIGRNLTETTFTDSKLPASSPYRRVSYAIVASSPAGDGVVASTQTIALGAPYEVPYVEDFQDAESVLKNYTIVDANHDDVSWVTYINEQYTYIVYTYNIYSVWTNRPADDWLITPSFQLRAGQTYRLSFDERCDGSETQCNNRVEVRLGRQPVASALTQELLPEAVYANTTMKTVTVEFTVSEDGSYNIGFHAMSDPRKTDFCLDRVSLEAATNDASPAAVSDLTLTPAAKGARTATIAFTAPVQTVGGSAIDALEKVRVMRDNKVLHTFEAPAPGEALSYTDRTAANGFNTYTVVATSGSTGDSPIAQVTGYVGIDVPAFDYTSVGVEDLGDQVRVKWAQVDTIGLNGGYVDTRQVGYAVYQVDYENENGMMTAGDYIDMAVGTDHMDVPLVTYEGEQRVVSYAIVAVNEYGADEYHTGATYGMPVGLPYALPFIQSASSGRLGSRMMWAETENRPDASYKYSSDSYDGDNGSFEWAPSDRTYTLSLNTGKITLAGATSPVLRFAHKGTPRSRYQLAVQIQTPDRVTTTLKDINYQTITGTSAQWTLESIDLSEYKDEEYIVVKFYLSSNATTNTSLKNKSLLIDAINVLDLQPYNLSIDIEAPASIMAGRGDDISMVVHNVGENVARDYSVTLYIDGEEVHSETVSEPLSTLGQKTISVGYRPTVFTQADRVTARAELQWLNDLVDEDNEMEEEIAITAPVVRQPQNATYAVEAESYAMTWEAPEQGPETVTESFEGPEYTDFDLCGITMEQREGMMGDWTVWNLDGDGTWNGPHGPTGHLPSFDSTELEGIEFPNMGAVCAWMVFNDDKVVGTMPIKPRTGRKMAATFDDFVQQDTWLISPELTGREQTIGFYAAAPVEVVTNMFEDTSEVEAPEVLEVLVSKGGLSLADFESLGTDTLTSQEWVDYEIDLEEGTKYFAIRNVTSDYGAMALFVDDVTYERLSPLPVSYNIYGDEQLLDNVLPGAEVSVDGRAAQYAVTAVYANGDESLPVAFTEASAISDATRQVQGEGAHRVYDLQGRRVAVGTGAGANASRFTLHSSLKPGLYIVGGQKRLIGK